MTPSSGDEREAALDDLLNDIMCELSQDEITRVAEDIRALFSRLRAEQAKDREDGKRLRAALHELANWAEHDKAFCSAKDAAGRFTTLAAMARDAARATLPETGT